MTQYLFIFLKFIGDHFRSAKSLKGENLALRQQLAVFKSKKFRPKLTENDRLFWIFFSVLYRNWRDILVIVKPETVLRWHRNLAKAKWKLKAAKLPGRPKLDIAIISLIKKMAVENLLWGAPRIHGELMKLGFFISERVVSKYLPQRTNQGPGGDWSSFLKNHQSAIISIDFFTVFTARFKQLRGFIIIDHERRKIIQTGATYNNSPEWIRNQFCAAFPKECVYNCIITIIIELILA